MPKEGVYIFIVHQTGASRQNSVAAFSMTTDVDGDRFHNVDKNNKKLKLIMAPYSQYVVIQIAGSHVGLKYVFYVVDFSCDCVLGMLIERTSIVCNALRRCLSNLAC